MYHKTLEGQDNCIIQLQDKKFDTGTISFSTIFES